MLIKIILIFFIILFTLCVNSSAFAQTPDFQIMKSSDGLIFVNNNKTQRFSFFVAGKNPAERQNPDGSFLLETDEGGLYAYFVRTTEFLDAKKTVDRLKILDAHRDHDIAAEEKVLQTKLQVLKGADFVEINDAANSVFPKKVVSSLYWSYSPPDSDGAVLYQTILLGDTVLMLRTVFPKTVKVDEVRAFFKKVLESVALLPPAKKASVAPKKQSAKPGRRKN